MTLSDFNIERDKRAKQSWDDCHAAWRTKDPDTFPIEVVLQWLFKEIASTQMIIDELAKHTKMPKFDEEK